MNIKIYSPTFEAITEIDSELISEIKISEKISGESISYFDIPISSIFAKIENLKIGNHIEFYEDETLYHDGWIKGGELFNVFIFRVYVGNYNARWQHRLIHQDFNFSTSNTYSGVLTSILSHINGLYDTGHSIESSASVNLTEAKEYEKGTTFKFILDDLAKSGFEYNSKNKKIYFDENIGIDRTLNNSNFYAFELDINDESINNIDLNKIKFDVSNLKNVIIGKDGTTYNTQQDNTSINQYGRFETQFTSRGDLTKSTQEELEKKKDLKKDLQITPIIDNYKTLGLGDICQLNILGYNDIDTFSGNAKIIQKEMTEQEIKQITFKININQDGIKEQEEIFADMQKKILRLEYLNN